MEKRIDEKRNSHGSEVVESFESPGLDNAQLPHLVEHPATQRSSHTHIGGEP